MPPINSRNVKRTSMRTKTVGGTGNNSKRSTYTSSIGGKSKSRISSSKTSSTRSRVKKKTISSKYGIGVKKEGFSTYKTYKSTLRSKQVKESKKVKAAFSLYSNNPKAVIKRKVDYESVIGDLIKSKQLYDNSKLLDNQLLDSSIDSISIEVSDCSSLLEDGYSDEDELSQKVKLYFFKFRQNLTVFRVTISKKVMLNRS